MSGIAHLILGAGGIEKMPLGLSAPLLTVAGDQGLSWQAKAVDLSDYLRHTVRLVWKVTMGTGGFVYTNDVQLDTIAFDGNAFNFDVDDDGFQAIPAAVGQAYDGPSFGAVQAGATGGYWSRETGATPSSGTGSMTAHSGTHYLFTEASSPTEYSDVFWLRSPSIAVSPSPGSCTFQLGMDVTDPNTSIEFFIDVEAQP